MDALWVKYKQDGDVVTRNQLIVRYLPVVKRIARNMASGLPPFVHEEDLASYGVFGLIDAIEKYDLDRGFKFETYAVSRIQGAILDELRSIDWAPRSVRAKKNAIERVMTNYEYGLPPTEREAARFLGMDDDDFNKFKTDDYSSHTASLDWEMGLQESDEKLTYADVLADERLDISSMMEYDHIRDKIAKTVNLMPERERMLVYLYYYEQLTLADIGRLMQVTESRVCQIHTSICRELKDALRF